MRPGVACQRIGGNDLEPVGIMRGDLIQRGNRALIALDGNDAGCAERQKRARQTAGPGSDFEHCNSFERSRRARDARGKVQVEQEVLAERFTRAQPVPTNNIAQRRQIIGGVRHDAFVEIGASIVAPEDPASRAASRKAAIRLAGSAVPVPAISNAVP